MCSIAGSSMISGAFRPKKTIVHRRQGREPLQDGKWQKMAFRYFWRGCITGGSKTLLLHPRGLGDEGNASWAQLKGSPRPQGPRVCGRVGRKKVMGCIDQPRSTMMGTFTLGYHETWDTYTYTVARDD